MDQVRSPPQAVPLPLPHARDRVLELPRLRHWRGAAEKSEADAALAALEAGNIVFLPALSFPFEEAERRLLDPAASDGRAKNISFDPESGRVRGTALAGDERRRLERLLGRYHQGARALVESLFPTYAPHLTAARASFRPVPIGDRPISFRKDDRRLHVDAFPSQPVQGRRILRVFTNVNPEGMPRVWLVGEPFAAVAARLAPRLRAPLPGALRALRWLGVTKGTRTAYDDLMLRLHDAIKADERCQRHTVRDEIHFPAGATWIACTDVVLHAATSGQHALEQTFHLPVSAMRDPALSPLRILERITSRALV